MNLYKFGNFGNLGDTQCFPIDQLSRFSSLAKHTLHSGGFTTVATLNSSLVVKIHRMGVLAANDDGELDVKKSVSHSLFLANKPQDDILQVLISLRDKKASLRADVSTFVNENLAKTYGSIIALSPRQLLEYLRLSKNHSMDDIKALVPEGEVALIELCENVEFPVSKIPYTDLKRLYKGAAGNSVKTFLAGCLKMIRRGVLLDICPYGVYVITPEGKTMRYDGLAAFRDLLSVEGTYLSAPRNMGIKGDRFLCFDTFPVRYVPKEFKEPLYALIDAFSNYDADAVDGIASGVVSEKWDKWGSRILRYLVTLKLLEQSV